MVAAAQRTPRRAAVHAVAVPVHRCTRRKLSLPQRPCQCRMVADGAGPLPLASPGGLARLPMLMPRSRRSHVRFSNRPFRVKRFQTIHHYSVDVAHGLVLLFGIGTKALPSWGSRRGGTIFGSALPL